MKSQSLLEKMKRGGWENFNSSGVLCVHKMVGRWAESKGKGQMLKGSIGHAREFMLGPMARIYKLVPSSRNPL